MKKMLNTLYITSEDAYLTLKGETVEILFEDGTKKRIPLINLESIVVFSYKGASPALMGKCEEYGISLAFFSPHGKYLATVGAAINGNVLLRREQNRISDNTDESLDYSKHFILGKLYNSKGVVSRYTRDHPLQVDTAKLIEVTNRIDYYISQVQSVDSIESVRGIEGSAASDYFSVFDEMILQRKDVFSFAARTRRPPMDRVNAMLSFGYTLLANDCAGALRGVGLDPYIGFMHTDRPGRKSLALDIMEELRSVMVDRFVLMMINNRVFNKDDFIEQETGAVLFKDDARKVFLKKWQERKKEEIMHPFLKEKIPWGLVPHSQALLLARCIRGDIDAYPPFFWR